MQSTRRLLATLTTASAGHSSRFLTAGNPTGLTGLFTHPSPRSTLVFLYAATLNKLSSLPPTSAYRVSLEALTKHRLSIVDAVKPEGYDAWAQRASQLVAEHPTEFEHIASDAPTRERLPDWVEAKVWGRRTPATWGKEDAPELEWDGEVDRSRQDGEQGEVIDALERRSVKKGRDVVNWVAAPKLEAKQISEIEEKIGAGLIEEVIEVAKGELLLVDRLAEHKVWEELAEKAPEGQWTYFARQQHMPGTEEPGNKP